MRSTLVLLTKALIARHMALGVFSIYPNGKGLFSIQSISASHGDGTNNNTLLKNLELRIINALMVSNSK